MKFYAYEEELYPVYDLLEPENHNPVIIEVAPEFYERYKAAMREFYEVQEIVGRLKEEAWAEYRKSPVR
jgi:hypothetical protein